MRLILFILYTYYFLSNCVSQNITNQNINFEKPCSLDLLDSSDIYNCFNNNLNIKSVNLIKKQEHDFFEIFLQNIFSFNGVYQNNFLNTYSYYYNNQSIDFKKVVEIGLKNNRSNLNFKQFNNLANLQIKINKTYKTCYLIGVPLILIGFTTYIGVVFYALSVNGLGSASNKNLSYLNNYLIAANISLISGSVFTLIGVSYTLYSGILNNNKKNKLELGIKLFNE